MYATYVSYLHGIKRASVDRLHAGFLLKVVRSLAQICYAEENQQTTVHETFEGGGC